MSQIEGRQLSRLMISCGGTGGHFNPGVSVADYFQKNGGNVALILGGKHIPKQEETARQYKLDTFKIRCAPTGKSPIAFFKFIKEQLFGLFQCISIMKKYKPDAVLAMGSFASIPPALAAYFLHIPLFLHDGNARIGKSNRFFSRFATGIALSFPAVNQQALHCPSRITGLPLRKNLLQDVPNNKQEAVKLLNQKYGSSFSAEYPVILVFGGSLGAKAINDNFSVPTDLAKEKHIQVIHLSGPGKLDGLRERYQESGVKALTLEASPDMQIMYMSADLVISRAGGSTISELTIFGRYSVLIPYPYASELHQNDNARFLQKTGAAKILSNQDCSEKVFHDIIRDFILHKNEYCEKGFKVKQIAQPNAAEKVIVMIDELAFPNRS